MPLPYAYLFVPGDDEHKIEKAVSGDAGAIILDLEDSVSPAHKDLALRTTRDFLASDRLSQQEIATPELWVRLNTTDPDTALAELSALPLARLTGVFYPKLAAHDSLVRMGHWLDALERRDEKMGQPVQIVGIITESARALVSESAASLARAHPRLRGYTWGVEDLSADLGRAPMAATAADRRIAEAVQLHCLYMAAAADVEAIDSISTAIRDSDVLAETCDMARALGYTAKMAIHPAQVEAINQHMAPAPDAIAWARRVQERVDEHPERSVFSLDGHMIDTPHIEAARRILERLGDKG